MSKEDNMATTKTKTKQVPEAPVTTGENLLEKPVENVPSTVPTPLPETVLDKGFVFRQVKRTTHLPVGYNVAMYSQHETYEGQERLIAFEIFTVKTMGNRVMFNTWVPLYERYPSNENIGTLGLSIGGLDKVERAEKVYQDMIEKNTLKAAEGPKSKKAVEGEN